MLNYKVAVTLCVLLLLTSALHESVNAQSEELERKLELGVQISGLAGGGSGEREGIGGGGRVTYNFTKFFAVEGEFNYLASATSFNDTRRFQGQFGIKSGLRFKRFGLFGKIRPGFINTRQDFFFFLPTPCVPVPGTVCAQSVLPVSGVDSDTGFSLDLGGVAELYPSKRIVVRLDIGDTIHNRQEPDLLISQPIFGSQTPPVLIGNSFVVLPGRSFTSHNLQLSAGVGFRF